MSNARRRSDGSTAEVALLTRELAIARYDFQRQQIIPDRLTTGEHAQYPAFAERMLDVYRRGTGRRRRDLHREIHQIFVDEKDCPQRRIDGVDFISRWARAHG